MEKKGHSRKSGKLYEWKDGKEILPANWRGYLGINDNFELISAMDALE
jgi:hypothetical protein